MVSRHLDCKVMIWVPSHGRLRVHVYAGPQRNVAGSLLTCIMLPLTTTSHRNCFRAGTGQMQGLLLALEWSTCKLQHCDSYQP